MNKSNFKQIFLTLALLITAATGAWAQAGVMPGLMAPTDNSTSFNEQTWTWVQVYTTVSGWYWDYEIKDDSEFASPTEEFKPSRTQLINALKDQGIDVCGNDGFVTTVQLLSDDGSVLNTETYNKALSWDENTRIKVPKTFFASIDAEKDYILRVNLRDCILPLNDTKTTSSFAMPASDVTVTYELVRDLTQQVTFGGIPTGNGLVVKNNGTAYEFVTTPDFTLTDALADNADIISAEGITITVGKMVEVEGIEGHRLFDEATAVSLADFLANPQPGTYKMKATATADGPYDGTIYSAEFTTVEKYDLQIQPADDFSKGKLSEVTVGGEAQTLDTDGKANATAAEGAEVKLKAKRGYVIEKVEAGKTVQN